MAGISIENVRKAFGRVEVIHGVDIEIGNGEFVALVGPSGCGKSTLLRMIAGLETITAGTIRIDGKVVNDLSPKERDIAMVFQNYALYPHMRVEANIGFGLKMSRTPKPEASQRIRSAADILGLSDHLDRYPRQLSGGQRQRVAMGRAIVRDPKAFLFDEPLSNLDAKLRVQMRAEIRQLHQRLAATTVYVTHDQFEAMTMADKIVVLQNGVVEQIGAPLQLYDQPRNLFVAGFIGSPPMNFLPGTVDGNIIRTTGGPMPLPDGMALEDGRSVVLGVRPEHLALGPAGQGGPDAEVSVVEQTGFETIVVLKFGQSEVQALLHERRMLAPGERLSLLADPASLHVFDEDSGLRL